MSITPLGMIVIPLTILVALLWPNWLFVLMVLLAPFQDSAVVTSSSLNGFGVQPGYYVGLIWLIYVTLSMITKQRIVVRSTLVKIIAVYLLFLAWALFTAIIMPRLLQGAIVYTPESYYDALGPNRFHVTQSVYLLFFSFLMVATCLYCSQESKAMVALRSIEIASLFVIAYGLYQVIGFYYDLPIPTDWIHNNPSISHGYGQTIMTSKRMSSVLGEPSFCASYLMGSLGIALGEFLTPTSRDRAAKTRTLVLFVGSVVALLLTVSTTAYASITIVAAGGLLLWLRRTLVNFVKTQAVKFGNLGVLYLIVGIVFAAATISAVLAVIPLSLQEATASLTAITVDKINSESAITRIGTDRQGFELLINSWGLGAGWGSNRCSSMVLTLLSSVGVPGFSLFLAFVVMVARTTFRTCLNLPAARVARVTCLGWLFVLLAHAIAVSDFGMLHFWLMPGIVLGAALTSEYDVNSREQHDFDASP